MSDIACRHRTTAIRWHVCKDGGTDVYDCAAFGRECTLKKCCAKDYQDKLPTQVCDGCRLIDAPCVIPGWQIIITAEWHLPAGWQQRLRETIRRFPAARAVRLCKEPAAPFDLALAVRDGEPLTPATFVNTPCLPGAAERVTPRPPLPVVARAAAPADSTGPVAPSQPTKRDHVEPVRFTAPNDRLMVVIPYCDKDIALAMDLLSWCAELGGCRPHDCLLLAANHIAESEASVVENSAQRVFREVRTVRPPYALPNEKWPAGPNWMFATAIRALREDRRPFLWLEPDCFPLTAGWLDRLESEYRTVALPAGKPYMGVVVDEIGSPDKPDGHCPKHLTGCAIYPPGIRQDLLPFTTVVGRWGEPWAWDLASHEFVVPQAHGTRLQHHDWGTALSLAPTYVSERNDSSPRHAVTIGSIPQGAVLAHRCKDGSAIRVLREMRT